MHVGDINMWYQKKGPNFSIYTTVPVIDQNNSPVSGATVYLTMTLPGGSTASGSGTTGTNGTITFKLTSKQTGTYTSRVTNVAKESATYDPGSNFETSESITVN